MNRYSEDNVNMNFIHKDSMPDHRFGTELMETFIDVLYNGGDMNKLVSHLEDLSNYFNINLPDCDPKIQVFNEEL